MSFRKTAALEGLTAGSTTTLGTISLGAPYGRVFGFTARLYGASTKAGAGTDVASKFKLTDADNRVVFLDAADRDYATAAVNLFFGQDETATGLSDLHADATGAALSSQAGLKGAICKSPVTVATANTGTATDYASIALYVEV